MTCIGNVCLENCPGWVQFLAVIGSIVVYVGLGFLFANIYKCIIGKGNKSLSQLTEDERAVYLFTLILWPIMILMGIIWWIIKLITMPFWVASKEELKETEERIIDSIALKEVLEKAKTEKPVRAEGTFLPGDLVVGVSGNPDGYKHLNEGCVCRVVECDEKGRMQLILVDHKDFINHKEQVGKTFKGPARNFTLYKDTTGNVKKSKKGKTKQKKAKAK